MKATAIDTIEPTSDAFGEVVFIAIPEPAYRKLSDLAAKRGQRVSVLIKEAFDRYLGGTATPSLLTEGKEHA